MESCGNSGGAIDELGKDILCMHSPALAGISRLVQILPMMRIIPHNERHHSLDYSHSTHHRAEALKLHS